MLHSSLVGRPWVVGVGLVAAACGGSPELGVPELPAVVRELPPDLLTVALDIPPGSSLGLILAPHGLSPDAVREAARPVHDLAYIRADHELSVTYADGAPVPREVRYELDADRVLVVRPTLDGWSAEVDEVPFVTEPVLLTLEIEGSLWEAGMAAGLAPADLVRIASVFEYEVDFNTEIQHGARLGLVGERRVVEGRRPRIESIQAVRLVNGSKVHEAVHFVDDLGNQAFYHPDGSSLERSFLRSPLAFSHVTSGFNPRRFHPILKIRRPHNGTDYGAPSGTPVRAVSSGTVTYAGRNGGHGNFVKIKHAGGIETSYSHLSRISVRNGQRIGLGDRIGTVGSTGLATGPHLHFQMWKNGRFVDSLRADLPSAPPLDRSQRAAFEAQVQRWLPQVPVPAPAG